MSLPKKPKNDKTIFSESCVTEKNLFSDSRGYSLSWFLQFQNGRIEKRFQIAAFLQTYHYLLYFHAIQAFFVFIDCFLDRPFPLLTYIQLIISIVFFKYSKIATSKPILQGLSFTLQIYLICRLEDFDAHYGFYLAMFVVWIILNSISWRQAAVILLVLFLLIHPLQIYFNTLKCTEDSMKGNSSSVSIDINGIKPSNDTQKLNLNQGSQAVEDFELECLIGQENHDLEAQNEQNLKVKQIITPKTEQQTQKNSTNEALLTFPDETHSSSSIGALFSKVFAPIQQDKSSLIFLALSILTVYFSELLYRIIWRLNDQQCRSERSYAQLFKQNSSPSFILNHLGIIQHYNDTASLFLPKAARANKENNLYSSNENYNFLTLLPDPRERDSLRKALEQSTLQKLTISIRANVKLQKNTKASENNSNNGNNGESQDYSGINTTQGNNSNGTGLSPMASGALKNHKEPSKNSNNTNSNGENSAANLSKEVNNFNDKASITENSSSNNNTKAPNTPKTAIASPPVRHQQQVIAPPQISKNAVIQKFPYPFMSDQFDEIMKGDYLGITSIQPNTQYFSISISPFIWKESAAFLITLTNLSEAQDFIKISNFFTKNLSERLVSVLSHSEEDFQKWANLAQLGQIKLTDLRELSAVISEQHNILIITTMLRYLNQMYIGQDKIKNQDFQITNLIIQTIEAHSVRLQNYIKRIDLSFGNGFPHQVNGDALTFYFVLYNLIYLMTYNCEYSDVDLQLGCTFLQFDKNNSLILSFDFDFAATQEQTDFFLRVTKQFEEMKRCLVQSDLQGHDIFDTIYLLTLNLIKQNEGSIHFEQVTTSNPAAQAASKKAAEQNSNNNNNNPNQLNVVVNQPQNQQLVSSGQSHSQQTIPSPVPPSGMQPQQQQQQQQQPDNSSNTNKQSRIVDSSAKPTHPQTPVTRLRVVLEYVFNTAEMHTVIKRQGESSITDSPQLALSSIDKKAPGKKYSAISKPPQINLSFTRTKEKDKDEFTWKQCKEEEKKLQASFGGGRKAEKPKPIQSLWMVSDENIPQPLSRNMLGDGVSPLIATKAGRKQSHPQNLQTSQETEQMLRPVCPTSTFSATPRQKDASKGTETQFQPVSEKKIPGPANATVSVQVPLESNNSSNTNKSTAVDSQKICKSNCNEAGENKLNQYFQQDEVYQAQQSKQQINAAPSQRLEQTKAQQSQKLSQQQSTSSSKEISSQKPQLSSASKHDHEVDQYCAIHSSSESSSVSQGLNELLNETENNGAVIQLPADLQKQVKQYLKLNNSNIIRDLSKIVRSILTQSKITENPNASIKISDRTQDFKKKQLLPQQFCSPQIQPSSVMRHQQIKIHSAFRGLINQSKSNNSSSTNTSKMAIPGLSSGHNKPGSRKDSLNCGEEQTPKSVAPSCRPSKTSFQNLLTSPSLMYNFRFRGERTLEQLKDPHLVGKNVAANNSGNSITNSSNDCQSSSATPTCPATNALKPQDPKPTLPWNDLIPWNVHRSRQKRHVREWTLKDVWNKLYKKTDTVLVITSDFNDVSTIKSIFQLKRDLGRDIDFTNITTAFDYYMGYLREAQVYKYFLIDLRIKQNEIEAFQNTVKAQEQQSYTIPKSFYAGYQSLDYAVYSFQLDFEIVGQLEVLKMIPIIKALKDRKH